MRKIKIDTSNVLNIPFQTYDNDFTFIVNDEEFQTSRLISDLLSPHISKIHLADPTLDKFTINTSQPGHFSYILNLINFEDFNVPQEEENFFIEVIEQLGNDKIIINNFDDDKEMTIDNILIQIKFHERRSKVFEKVLTEEINFISKHFFELTEEQTTELKKLKISILYEIFNNDKLILKSEDQLLQIVNDLYIENSDYSFLYETVNFLNATTEKVNEFISIFNYENMTAPTWNLLCNRLSSEVKLTKLNNERYNKLNGKRITIETTNDNDFNGIIHNLINQTNGDVSTVLSIRSSSSYWGHIPTNVIDYDNSNSIFHSKNEPNSWICFDFKEHRVIPTDYMIKSSPFGTNHQNPRNWVIECSNDDENWEIIDEKINCPDLNSANTIRKFHINQNNQKEFKIIRMRSTGQDWKGKNYVNFAKFELFGTLI